MVVKTVKTASAKAKTKTPVTPARYIEGIGRRKTAVARVRIWPGENEEMAVNGRPFTAYFPTSRLQHTAQEAFNKAKLPETFRTSVQVTGGGISAQAEAVRHGLARAMVSYIEDVELRKRLKRAGFLKRDPRVKERRKFGLKKARRAPQWSKR